MKVVADAGPLLAFAKIGALGLLHGIFPKILTPPAVYEETVTAGLELGAPDATLLATEYRAGRLVISRPRQGSLTLPAKLGLGEEESIRLAIDEGADRLLIDDFAARQAAENNLRAAKVQARVQGTLGVIVSARLAALVSASEAVGLIEAIERRADIWVHPKLCEKVKAALRRGS